MTIITILNLMLFAATIGLFFQGYRIRRACSEHRKTRAAAAEIGERIAPRLLEIRRVNISGIHTVQNATETVIQRFSSLERRIRTTTGETRQILDLMREKIALGGGREMADSGGRPPHPEVIRYRYETLFDSLLDQLSLITERKNEEAQGLEAVQARLASVIPEPDTAHEIETRLRNTISEIREGAGAEERLIRSTLGVLEDLVLSLVDSFIRINGIVDRTLGESSSLGDEIADIMVNLQCEDICQETGEMTLSHLTAVIRELKALNGDASLWESGECPAPAPKRGPEKSAGADEEEENVTFF